MPSPFAAVAWPVRSRRLTIRPATLADAEPTWRFRRLPSVGQWMTSSAPEQEQHRGRFTDPGQLVKTLIIELDSVLIGDLMLAIEDA